MKKELISAVLTAVTLCSAFGMSVSAADSGNTDYSEIQAYQSAVNQAGINRVEVNCTADKAMAGSGMTVSYTLSLSGIENSRGLQTALKYDTSKLEFVSVEPLAVMNDADTKKETISTGKVGIVCAFDNAVDISGKELARIHFRVKDTVENGVAKVSVVGTKIALNPDEYLDAEFVSMVDDVYVYQGQMIQIQGTPSVHAVVAGDTLSYVFRMSRSENFKGMQFSMKYDSDLLEYTDTKKGEVLNTAAVSVIKKTSDGNIQGMINYNNGYSGEGELFTISFKVNQSAQAVKPQFAFDTTAYDYVVFTADEVTVYPTEPAQEVINAINAIGSVSLDSKAAIDYAREIYDQLPDSVKERVANYDVLLKSEEEYQKLYDALAVFECILEQDDIKIIKNKPCDEALKLYIAQYAADGSLIQANIHDIQDSESIAFDRQAQTDHVRCFIWNTSMGVYESVEYK